MENTVILNGLIAGVLRSLTDRSFDVISRVMCVKKDVEILTRLLEAIMAVIREADGHRVLAQSEAADHRLKKLREIAYEAENIIDLFRIEVGSSRPQEWDAASICKCVKEVHIRYQIGNDIQELNKKLDTLMPALQQLGLAAEDQSGIDSEVAPHHKESSTIGRSVGRECSDLINLLQRSRKGDHVLFAIVGTIGVGKSTLARKIYHEMRSKFRTRLWVSISKDSRLITIWSGENLTKKGGMAEQRQLLRRYLNGSTRNLLLVIDNVWKADDWNQLLAADEDFRYCGCKVLVTTRDESVARTMGVTHFHRVNCLNEDDGWLLLHKTANLGETVATGNIQDVGRGIVQKCSGLPMAIRTIGWSLRGRSREDEWENIRSQDFISAYPGIRDSIDTAYMELKYRVKRCFLYCSLYPEEFVIKQQCVTQQWIAEGFFEGIENLEEEAARCYQELIERGLLVLENEANGVVGAKMPNLLRSFALYRSGDENYVDNPSRISSSCIPWRMCISDDIAVEAIPDDMTRLRTLFVFASPLRRSNLDIIFQRFPKLRVLDLRDTQVVTIPKMLGRLLQLRYLNLSNTRIRKLPQAIGGLMMLQFLILKNCSCLTKVTSHVGRLENLRGLDISGTPMLNDVHFRLHKLTELNCLQGFFPADHGWTLEELRALPNLTSLQILKLSTTSRIEDARQSGLQEMNHLRELELCCNSVDQSSVDDQGQEHIKDVLDALKPAQSLASLKLDGYYGMEFPSWLSVSHLTRLQWLTLDGCSLCERLPALGEMMFLKFLAITGFNVLTEINYELRGEPATGVAFPRLEQLLLGKMLNMVSWSGLGETDMPLLQSLHLDRCPRMISVPSWLQHCTALKSLKIQHAGALQYIGNLPALKELQVHNNASLERILNLRRLEDLKIVNCARLNTVQDVPLLRVLHLDEHSAQLPEWLQKRRPFTLGRLEIIGSEDLLDKCSSSVARYGRVIKGAADHVYAKLHDGSIYFSYTKSTGVFEKSRRCRDRSNMHNAATLAVPVVPHKIHRNRETRIKYTLCAIVLIVSQVLVQWVVSST